MSKFLDLPAELVLFIVEELVSDHDALNNLCLVGNHRLLAMARPLTWRQVNLVGPLRPKKSEDNLPNRFLAFTSDSTKAAAVRSIDITLRGIFSYSYSIFGALETGLPKLVNVTHAHISCFEIQPASEYIVWLVSLVLESLPALASISVDGCNEDDDSTDYSPPLSKSLVHVACRFCGPALMGLLQHIPNIKVLEMEGGDGREYWMDRGPHIGEWGGYEGSVFPVAHMMNESLHDSLERLHIIGKLDMDGMMGVVDFFELDVDVDVEPPPRLSEVVIELPLEMEEYREIFFAIRGPNIKRLKLTTFNTWTALEFTKLMEEVDERTRSQQFDWFESLEELWLPSDGLSPVLIPLLCSILSQARELKHLYFEAPRTDEHALPLLDVTTRYACALCRLESVSWLNVTRVRISRGEGGDVLKASEASYRAPWWQYRRGIGNWWEM